MATPAQKKAAEKKAADKKAAAKKAAAKPAVDPANMTPVQKAQAAKKNAPRRDAYTKTEFVERLRSNLEAIGVKVSKQITWDTAKTVVDTLFDMAFEKPVSLSGIGKVHFIESARSGRLKPRFRVSTRIEDALNAGGDTFEPTKLFTEPATVATDDDSFEEALDEGAEEAGETAEETAETATEPDDLDEDASDDLDDDDLL